MSGSKATGVRREVLDPSVLRGASVADLEALRTRGFVISLPVFGMMEVWSRAVRDDKPGLIFAALRCALPRLDEHEPFVVTGGHQAREVGTVPPHIARLFAGEHRPRGRAVRAELLRVLESSMSDDEFALYRDLVSGFKDQRESYKRTLEELWNTPSTIDPTKPMTTN
ncbi:hypothetical protein [Sorangium sp. So ce204]|uniref:hypothetical protein n=1 Tax=Sorangium sp. So ce204 TaxID=3133288 RepID=UPI003F637CAF